MNTGLLNSAQNGTAIWTLCRLLASFMCCRTLLVRRRCPGRQPHSDRRQWQNVYAEQL